MPGTTSSRRRDRPGLARAACPAGLIRGVSTLLCPDPWLPPVGTVDRSSPRWSVS